MTIGGGSRPTSHQHLARCSTLRGFQKRWASGVVSSARNKLVTKNILVIQVYFPQTEEGGHLFPQVVVVNRRGVSSTLFKLWEKKYSQVPSDLTILGKRITKMEGIRNIFGDFFRRN